ncbi:DUF4233 domain-containing protein [Microbacterium halophytorum]|uniref:DUF4233 domain-containing protein n=1 Tax=Microbacterium halophytorum TaxID=2067568 RepID=UPI000CFAEDA4|nr:DUF4233 domain-containing protein [Microbacterium halophytorum]
MTRAPKPRRYRPLQEKIGQIVLGFEAIVAFLAGLVLYGLDALGDLPPWWGVVAGSAMAVLFIVASGLLRYRWGYGVGWALQVVMLLGGFLEPGLFVAGLVFGALWAYAVVWGARTEARVQRQRAAQERERGDES